MGISFDYVKIISMPRKETKFRILLSSPSDLGEERLAVSEVLTELNKTWGRRSSANVEILSWEENCSPGFASEPQAVVNNSFGDEWDIYLGLMFSRFGTATQQFGSGTEEEFERAFSLWEKSKQNRRLLFYFRTGSIDIKTIDLAQLQKVRTFQKSISERGGLYWEYSDVAALKGFLRVHLSDVLSQLKDYSDGKSIGEQSNQVVPFLEGRAIEPGILDYHTVIEESAQSIKSIFEEHNTILNELTALMGLKIGSIQNAAKTRDFDKMKYLVSILSEGFRQSAQRFGSIRSKYAEDSKKFFGDVTMYLSLAAGKASLAEKKELIEVLKKGLVSMRVLTEGSQTVRGMMDKWINIARELTLAREYFQNEFDAFHQVTQQNIAETLQLLAILGSSSEE